MKERHCKHRDDQKKTQQGLSVAYGSGNEETIWMEQGPTERSESRGAEGQWALRCNRNGGLNFM